MPTHDCHRLFAAVAESSQPPGLVVEIFDTFALMYSPPRFNAYSAACCASCARLSLVAVRCSNMPTATEPNTIRPRISSITMVMNSVAAPRCFRGKVMEGLTG